MSALLECWNIYDRRRAEAGRTLVVGQSRALADVLNALAHLLVVGIDATYSMFQRVKHHWILYLSHPHNHKLATRCSS